VVLLLLLLLLLLFLVLFLLLLFLLLDVFLCCRFLKGVAMVDASQLLACDNGHRVRIRGYHLVREEQQALDYPNAGVFTVNA
jgi:hypothetical protein